MTVIVNTSEAADAPKISEPRSGLEPFTYSQLTLVSVIPNLKLKKKSQQKLAACFLTPDNNVVWVKLGDRVGTGTGMIIGTGKGYIVIDEATEVNGGDWVDRSFRWPATDKKELTARCLK